MKKLIPLLFLAIHFAGYSLTTAEKAKIVENVYKRIYATLGTAEEKPKFFFDTKAAQMAYMMNGKDGFPMIGFEEKAFDVCATLGARRDDAIAYILGHELTHHTMKHHWGKQFASSYNVNVGKTIRGIDNESIIRFEAQADERGGILCFLAGYKSAGITDKLLPALYTAYAFQENPKYPSIAERIAISQQQDSIVQTYVKVFEAANFAMIMKEYPVAVSGYEFLIGKGFHSREIYNNLGVLYYLQASEMAGEKEMKFIYPVEIDLQSCINRGGTKGFGADAQLLFEQAIEKFDQAYRFDNTYSTALLNKGCVFSVLGNYDEARVALNNADILAKKEGLLSVRNNTKLARSIVEMLDPEGDKLLGKNYIDELLALNHDYAIINKQIIDGKDWSEIAFTKPLGWTGDNEAAAGSTARQPREIVDGITDYSNATATLVQAIQFSKSRLDAYTRDASVIYVVPFKQEDLIFHATSDNYTGKSAKGMQIGSTDKELIDAYGTPTVILSSRQGWIYNYPNNKMMVFISADKKIEKWVVYSTL
ncbi:MAG: hypothetical protein V4638_08525 [Bacteroidota bacterium]